MRMHRGSSKVARGRDPAAETLPLSASADTLIVAVEVVRAARSRSERVELPPGATVRDAVRAVGESPEGVAVLCDGTPVPLDRPLTGPTILTVLPTFSGG
jgi:sulfur carrier protein ThiS